MDYKEALGLGELSKAAGILAKEPKKLFYIVLFDIIFLFSYGFFVQTFLNKNLEYIISMASYFSQESAGITREYLQKGLFSFINETAGFAKLFYPFLGVLILALVSFYIIYVLFQGLSWRAAKSENLGIANFLKIFARVNVPWLIIFLIIQSISLLTLYLKLVSERLGMPFPFDAYNAVIILAALVLIYFTLISYGLIGNQKRVLSRAFYLGFARAFSIIPKYLLIILIFIVLFKALEYLLLFNTALMVGIGFVAVMPAIALTKVYTNLIIKNIAKD